ncbi:MAG: DUF6526 family protein [Longimicrobiales bacterium]|nr:DUF6526 family protein [Longimicrobiales bacterium]
MSQPQSAASHAKMVPMYHYVTFALVFIPTVYFLYRAVTAFSMQTLMTALLGVGVILATLFARLFALGAQDRVIRLEERLRLARVLPAEMQGGIEAISTSILIGLRFAPDDELEDLVRRVQAGELMDRKAIKMAVKNWRADHQRI